MNRIQNTKGLGAKAVEMLEELVGKPLSEIERTYTNQLKLAFCYYKASYPNQKITYEEFITWTDEHFEEYDALSLEMANSDLAAILLNVNIN